jgi:hypothetical protein
MFVRNLTKTKIGKTIQSIWNQWFVQGDKISKTGDMIFIDGLVSFDDEGKIAACKNDAQTITFPVSFAERIIKVMGIKSKDVFLGREGNYLFFRNGNLNIKTTSLTINANDININANKIIFNGVNIYSIDGKLKIGNDEAQKEVAVIGGDVDPITNKIITSGQ